LQTDGHAIIQHHTVFTQHEAVTCLVDAQFFPGVGIDAIQELTGILTLDYNLAEGGGIYNADVVTRGQAFPIYRIVHGLPWLGVVPWALPLAYIFKLRALLFMPGVHSGLTPRFKQLASDILPGNSTEGNRCIVGPESCRARFTDLLTQTAGKYRHTVNVTDLTLIGSETQCGIALNVLNGMIPFTRRQHDIGRSHIILHINELFGAPAR